LLADQLPFGLADIASSNGSDFQAHTHRVSQPYQDSERISFLESWPLYREGDDLAKMRRRCEMRSVFGPDRQAI